MRFKGPDCGWTKATGGGGSALVRKATPMCLVIFDIDGTLIKSTETDADCFVRSLAEICGFGDVDTDWSRYKRVTDSGVFHEIHEARTGRTPSAVEVSRFRQHFVSLLAQASSECPLLPMAGAPQLLAWLSRSEQYRVALATGAWREAARLKMASAGLCYDDYPAAAGDDASGRESIIRLSMRRAADRYGGFDSAVYIGDAVWDARACRAVGIPFIGIGVGARATRLLEEGAMCVFPDLSDQGTFLRSLDASATWPGTAAGHDINRRVNQSIDVDSSDPTPANFRPARTFCCGSPVPPSRPTGGSTAGRYDRNPCS